MISYKYLFLYYTIHYNFLVKEKGLAIELKIISLIPIYERMNKCRYAKNIMKTLWWKSRIGCIVYQNKRVFLILTIFQTLSITLTNATLTLQMIEKSGAKTYKDILNIKDWDDIIVFDVPLILYNLAIYEDTCTYKLCNMILDESLNLHM